MSDRATLAGKLVEWGYERDRLTRQNQAMREALQAAVAVLRCIEIPISRALESDTLIEAAGLNPWCVNEGLATGEELTSLDSLVFKIEAALAAEGDADAT